jgi:hypothetical protein
MGYYITSADVKGKAVNEPITRAGWTDADINSSIDEAENYIESRLLKIGYTREQLQTASLVYNLCINYARYCVLRDIYTQTSPSRGGSERYEKWQTNVNEILDAIEKNEIKLIDGNGNVIKPLGGDKRYKTEITTENTKRIFKIADTSTWQVDDETYASDDVVGQK